ncbi:transcriptional regulator GfcR [Natronorubrum bangense]|uniref:Transcriptional regulator GfcR n=2 Tax=Natronorubrum bangense TaxID=61858 RepID=L9WHX0_9EURY|nr:transcriptional regulator GfcR [Natronorubrum bangense]ELY49100.1 orotate phosphoribosyltransferase-like protein [Natronorubrum bangense JCM 10635]QCC57017.1 PRK02277 family protein [Natronorubrum bangense]
MKNVDDLIASAAELTDQNLSKGTIADELNVSRETASWLVKRSGAVPRDTSQRIPDIDDLQDVHIDWSAVGEDSNRMTAIAMAMTDLLANHGRDIDLTVGIEKAGAPIASLVASELETSFATYAPSKHQRVEADTQESGGAFSRNFAPVHGRECYIVDDTITSGTTMRETIEAIRSDGGNPLACVVLVDKQGVDELADVPVYSLFQVIQIQ